LQEVQFLCVRFWCLVQQIFIYKTIKTKDFIYFVVPKKEDGRETGGGRIVGYNVRADQWLL
jgi:hypothetical protein